MITGYFYQGQLRRYVVQFAAIFAGLMVKTGKGRDGEISDIPVPISYGSRDRVVAAVGAGFTQNKPVVIPTMTCYLQGIDIALDRMKGVGFLDRRVHLPAGGVFPDDLKTVERYMPVPYDLTFELNLVASNTDQLYQMLEQILCMFDPTLQIQTSDAPFDWTKITCVTLMSSGNEENWPMGTDRRLITWTLSFKVDAYLGIPAELRDQIVKNVIIQYGDMDGFAINEYTEDGDMVPFADPFGQTVVQGSPLHYDAEADFDGVYQAGDNGGNDYDD